MNKAVQGLRPAMALAAVLGVTACSLTPTYERPQMAVPAQFPADTGAQGATDPRAVANLPWEVFFPDANLQELIRLALGNNRDLRVAVLNIEQLRATYQIQRADRFPTLNASINAVRQPSNLPPFELGTTVTAGVGVSAFELDLFGRVRALSEAAAAQYFASQEARKAAHISLIASVADTYYALWADRWQLALAEQTLQTRQESLRLLRLKFDNGVLNELDLRSGESLVEQARATRAQAQRQWSQDLSALNLLLGATAPDNLLPPVPSVDMTGTAKPGGDGQTADQAVQAVLWPSLSELPVGISSEVLLQRPDIAQAEQQLISANANIGAARAARFPRISLTGQFGVVSDSLSGLFNDGRNAWSFSPAVSVPIFDAGRGRAGVEQAVARRDIAVAQYDKAIQTAFKEVADSLVARRTLAEQTDAQLAQARAEAARMRLSALRYETGVASQLDLLDAQRSFFAAQQALITSQLARQQAHISVYRALGGGWVSAGDAAAAPPQASSASAAAGG